MKSDSEFLEYKVVCIYNNSPILLAPEAEKTLNSLAAEGWELVSVSTVGSIPCNLLYLKRRLP